MAINSKADLCSSTVEKRFRDKYIIRENDCWEWIAYTTRHGYGSFRLNGNVELAHRASWIIYKGNIPRGTGYHGICALHKCDNRKCVNPDHLFLGTQKENIRDGITKGRIKGWNNGRGGIKGRKVSFTDETIQKRLKRKNIDRNLVRALTILGMPSTEIGRKLGINPSWAWRIGHFHA